MRASVKRVVAIAVAARARAADAAGLRASRHGGYLVADLTESTTIGAAEMSWDAGPGSSLDLVGLR